MLVETSGSRKQQELPRGGALSASDTCGLVFLQSPVTQVWKVDLAGHRVPQGRNQTPPSALLTSCPRSHSPRHLENGAHFTLRRGVSAPSPSLGEPGAATVSKNPSSHNHVWSGSHHLGKKDKGAE